ncbi:hypothetical protein ACFYXF_20605 [Streptomyces sp. NPDC002680]|uniref:hypothetical protein n=1 Tax=Streptomyces sp. NPDC002680 TaxID=3364659 RepID=UPI0036B27D5E
MPALPCPPKPLGVRQPGPLTGQRIAVVGPARRSVAVATRLAALGALTSVHAPGHVPGGTRSRRLDGVVVLLPPSGTRGNAPATAGAGRPAPRWTLVLDSDTSPDEIADTVERLGSGRRAS